MMHENPGLFGEKKAVSLRQRNAGEAENTPTGPVEGMLGRELTVARRLTFHATLPGFGSRFCLQFCLSDNVSSWRQKLMVPEGGPGKEYLASAFGLA